MLYFLDSNIFLRSIIPDVPPMHRDCFKLFGQVKQGDMVIGTATVVLAEIAWTLKSHYRKNRLEIALILKSINYLPGLQIIDDYQHYLANQYFSEYNIKYIDCLIASSKSLKAGKWQLVSYDTDFDKIKDLKRLEPHAIVLPA